MNSRQWLKRMFFTTLVFVGLPIFVVMGFNYWIDPLWNFSHKHEYNDYQLGFDERQLKTNFINSREFEYDSLIIGTSRVTYMDASKFERETVFNYSLSSLYIDEYLPYIQYAAEKNGEDFDTIFMELYQGSYLDGMVNEFNDPDFYFEKSGEPFYKIKSLFSYNTLESSMDNYDISKANYFSGPRSYNRENVTRTTYPNDNVEEMLTNFATNFEKRAATNPVKYSDVYKDYLLDLKKTYPNTKFVVFTDPMPYERLVVTLSNREQREAFEQWYREMVDVFGEVYSFQGETPITTNSDYFFDTHHYYPIVGDMMIEALEQPKEYDDVLYIVNEENIDKYLSEVIGDAEVALEGH